MEKSILSTVFPWQISALQLFGVFPWQKPEKKWRGYLQLLLIIVFIGGGLVSCTFQIVQALVAIINPTDWSMNPIIRALTIIIPLLMNLRGVLVITLLYLKRDTITPLAEEVDKLLHMSFPQTKTRLFNMNRWKVLASWSFATTAVIALLVEGTSWKAYMATQPSNWTMTDNFAYAPFMININWLQSIIIIELFESWPLYLSQQIHLLLTGLALITWDCLKEINLALKFESEKIAKCEPNLAHTAREETMTHLLRLHSLVVNTAEAINDTFGVIFLTTYSLDLLLFIAVMVSLVFDRSTENSSWIVSSYCLLAFLQFVNTTIFQLPQVCMHEQVGVA